MSGAGEECNPPQWMVELAGKMRELADEVEMPYETPVRIIQQSAFDGENNPAGLDCNYDPPVVHSNYMDTDGDFANHRTSMEKFVEDTVSWHGHTDDPDAVIRGMRRLAQLLQEAADSLEVQDG